MTLLDAPQFDEVRDRRNRVILSGLAGAALALLTAWWLVAGRPVDWPWNWNAHLFGRAQVNRFFAAVETNHLETAYGIWINDSDWKQHEAEYDAYPYERFLADRGYAGKRDSLDSSMARNLADAYGKTMHDKDWLRHQERLEEYPFSRFMKDWSPSSASNDYGAIRSHRIAATRMNGNVLQAGIFVNGRKSKAINLDYDPADKMLSYSPDFVQFLEGPGGIT